MIREAKFCETKKNRYFLKREWDRSKGLLLYIMLNPSMADDTNDDPTISSFDTKGKRAGK